jgi:hypothetical protein
MASMAAALQAPPDQAPGIADANGKPERVRLLCTSVTPETHTHAQCVPPSLSHATTGSCGLLSQSACCNEHAGQGQQAELPRQCEAC